MAIITIAKNLSVGDICYYSNLESFHHEIPLVCIKPGGTTTVVLRPFVRDYPGEPVPEETFTHTLS